MGRKSSPEEPEKVHRLSLAELAAHDDACSDAMVDNAYFKSQIRKNRTKYNPLRGIKDDEVRRILLHNVIVGKDPVAAEKSLLQLPGLKRYRSGLRSRAEKDNFLAHLRKYIYMYMTDCPWEVSTTNRYTITTYEAAVTARQRVKQGQVIKYLVGTLVPLTIAESADLDLTNRNFSIVVSSRKKNSSIFLGPARFANHDCDANGRLVTRGSDGMEVLAVKNIEVGDEITVSYGDDYFGPGNIDCLCHTCERLIRNGWGSARTLISSRHGSRALSEESTTSESAQRKRKRGEDSTPSESIPPRPPKLARLKASPSKLQHSWTPPTSNEDEVPITSNDDRTITTRTTRRSLRGQDREGPVLSPPTSPNLAESPPLPPENHQLETAVIPHGKSTRQFANLVQPSKTNIGHLSEEQPGQQPPTPQSDHGSYDLVSDENTIVIKMESVETTKVESDHARSVNVAGNGQAPHAHDLSPSHDSIMVSTLTTTETSKTLHPSTAPVAKVMLSIEPASTPIVTASSTTLSVLPLSETVRIPGDYLLTRKLLAQPHDRWVQCHNERCLGFFIQPNGYQTRRECPRCERHSMLYGFSWPKTDPDPRKIMERDAANGSRARKIKTGAASGRSAYRRAGRCGKGSWVEGGGDEEERVMDHRTVHRFVLPEDEKTTARKGLLQMAELARLRGEDVELTDGKSNVGRRRTDSVGIDSNLDRASLTPDGELRRRSHRFVTKIGVYADV